MTQLLNTSLITNTLKCKFSQKIVFLVIGNMLLLWEQHIMEWHVIQSLPQELLWYAFILISLIVISNLES